MDQIRSALLVEVNDNLTIGARSKLVTTCQELLTQRLKVINLAIEDHPHRAVLIAERLMPAVQIDNAQAPHTQSDLRLNEETFVVRPAVAHDRTHRTQVARVHGTIVKAHDSGNATHRIRRCWGRERDCSVMPSQKRRRPGS